MFYLLPAAHACCLDKTQESNEVHEMKKWWAPLELTGLILDITVVALLVISCSITLCAHLGMNMGILNCLSAISIPVMITLWSTATLLILSVIAKLAYKQGHCENDSEHNKKVVEEEKNEVSSSTCVSAHASEKSEKEKSKKSESKEESVSGGQKADTAKESSSESEKEDKEMSEKESSSESKFEKEEPKEAFPQRTMETPLIYFYEQPLDGSTSFVTIDIENEKEDEIIDMGEDLTDNKDKANSSNMWGWNFVSSVFSALTGATGTAANALNNMAGKTLQWIKTWFAPGELQMRFYSLQLQFLVDQILLYSEFTTSCHPGPVPISFVDKLSLLSSREFICRDIENFKKRFLDIIQKNKGHPFSSRYYILLEIENAFNNLAQKSASFHRFLQVLCYQLYTQFDAYTYGQKITEQFLGKAPLSFATLHKQICEDQKRIKDLPQDVKGNSARNIREGARSITGVAYWPMLTNNFACPLWKESYANGQTVEVLRFGSPTSQDMVSARVLGQMELFIQELKQQKKTLLSFYHSSYKGDATRLAPLKNLANVYIDTFFFLNMEMDSEFYHQTRKGIDVTEKSESIVLKYEDFKQQLLEHVQHFDMSDNLAQVIASNDTYKENVEQLVDDVLKYFPDCKGQLTQKQRQDFISLFYGRYRQYMHHITKTTHSCSQCAEVDHSMHILALSFMQNAMDLKQHEDPNTLRHFRTLSHFAGMVVKGSPTDDKPFERFESALAQLTKANKDSKIKHWVSRQEMFRATFNHKYSILPCNAKNEKDYLATALTKKRNKAHAVMPVPGGINAARLVEHLYRNNGLNISVSFDEASVARKNFQVYQNNEKNVLVSGIFYVENNKLMINIITKKT